MEYELLLVVRSNVQRRVVRVKDQRVGGSAVKNGMRDELPVPRVPNQANGGTGVIEDESVVRTAVKNRMRDLSLSLAIHVLAI